MRRLLLLPAALLAPSALAHEGEHDGFDAHGFKLAAFDADPRDPLQVMRAGRFEQGDWFAGGLFEYAESPLVLVTQVEGADPETNAVLDSVFALNLSAGVAALDNVRLDLGMPFYFSSEGETKSPDGPAFGDLRFAVTAGLVRPEENGGGLGVALIPYVDFPTGDEERFLGQPGLAYGGRAALTWEGQSLTASGDIGMQFNPEIDLENLSNADRLVAGLALGWLFDENLGFNVETRFEPPFSSNVEPGTDSPMEALASLRGTPDSGGQWVVGGGAAFSGGASAAIYRVFVGGGFGTAGRGPQDLDLDGILDRYDACIDQPEVVNGWKDEDGCPDALSALAVTTTFEGRAIKGANVALKGGERSENRTSAADPIVLEGLTPQVTWMATASAPPCLEGAGSITLAEGQNTLAIEMQRTAPAKLVVEIVDDKGKPVSGALIRVEGEHPECIIRARYPGGSEGRTEQEQGAGNFTVTVTHNDYLPFSQAVTLASGGTETVKVVLTTGKVKVSEQAIIILDKVYFETDKDVIKPESFPLLDQVASIFISHPDIKVVEISGHTDSQGNDAYNLDLSDRRAKSVRQYLINKGVDGARMIAKGYGETRPIANNKTASGRAQNRRVEFNILERAREE